VVRKPVGDQGEEVVGRGEGEGSEDRADDVDWSVLRREVAGRVVASQRQARLVLPSPACSVDGRGGLLNADDNGAGGSEGGGVVAVAAPDLDNVASCDCPENLGPQAGRRLRGPPHVGRGRTVDNGEGRATATHGRPRPDPNRSANISSVNSSRR
jgi:hypothetical protein